MLEGADQVEAYFKLILPKVTGIALIPAILLAASFALDWVSGLIMFVTFPFIILYMVIMGHTAKEKASRQHRTFEIMSNHFIDTLRGIDTLKLFVLTPFTDVIEIVAAAYAITGFLVGVFGSLLSIRKFLKV